MASVAYFHIMIEIFAELKTHMFRSATSDVIDKFVDCKMEEVHV